MDPDLFSTVLPGISAQLRIALHNLHLAAAQLVPAPEREQDPELDARAALLDQSYYRLLRLVNQLNAAAFYAAGRQLKEKNQDITALVREVFAAAESLSPLLGLELRLRCPEEAHLCAFDAQALEQALYQLLSNAFKFTPRGGSVTVELQLAPGRVLLSVTDTGCGIPPETVDTLFDRCRSGEELPVPPQGLGLGLGLCRAIAAAHGGTLLADSKVGKGSRFVLSLPDRLLEAPEISDVDFDYSGGFNPVLVNLADALPAEAFRLRNQR